MPAYYTGMGERVAEFAANYVVQTKGGVGGEGGTGTEPGTELARSERTQST